MRTVYSLYPSDRLRALRTRFPDYAIFEVHDAHGRSEFAAVLTHPDRAPGAAVLLSATTADELAAQLHRPTDEVLTERLRDALYAMRDRGLLPDWHPGPERW